MSAPDTGFSTRSIIAASDNSIWPRILAMLQDGGTLYRPTRMRSYYTDYQGWMGQFSLSAARVKRLEREGVLRVTGVDRYGLVPASGGHDV